MICFKDRQFCSDGGECKNYECKRHWSDELEAEAEAWMKNAPVSWGSFKDTCGQFEAIDKGGND